MHLKGEPIRHWTIVRLVGIERYTGRDSHRVFYTGVDIHSLISHHLSGLTHCIETHCFMHYWLLGGINNGLCMLSFLLQCWIYALIVFSFVALDKSISWMNKCKYNIILLLPLQKKYACIHNHNVNNNCYDNNYIPCVWLMRALVLGLSHAQLITCPAIIVLHLRCSGPCMNLRFAVESECLVTRLPHPRLGVVVNLGMN